MVKENIFSCKVTNNNKKKGTKRPHLTKVPSANEDKEAQGNEEANQGT